MAAKVVGGVLDFTPREWMAPTAQSISAATTASARKPSG